MDHHEILVLSERVDIARHVGESHFREFKSAYEGPPGKKRLRDVKEVCRDIAEALVAFANADGGELIVGIEDDGSVTGLDYSDATVQILLKPRVIECIHILHSLAFARSI